jgi:hypothetical protein
MLALAAAHGLWHFTVAADPAGAAMRRVAADWQWRPASSCSWERVYLRTLGQFPSAVLLRLVPQSAGRCGRRGTTVLVLRDTLAPRDWRLLQRRLTLDASGR